MTPYWTVIRSNGAALMMEWVQAPSAAKASQTRTAVTNAGFTRTLFAFRGRHFDRLGFDRQPIGLGSGVPLPHRKRA